MTRGELARSLGRHFELESTVTAMDILLVCLFAAGFSGGFVNGLAGFGTSLFALGWLLQVMSPRDAVAIALACSVVTGVPGVWQVWASIDWRRL
ncbi:MAG: sulfite exporter TauE/SafE family protein, partial [Pseudomonadota bacterium]|nr:sulfite exporter TauE/SafE family protein [Pseudomonadota bacterium]